MTSDDAFKHTSTGLGPCRGLRAEAPVLRIRRLGGKRLLSRISYLGRRRQTEAPVLWRDDCRRRPLPRALLSPPPLAQPTILPHPIMRVRLPKTKLVSLVCFVLVFFFCRHALLDEP